MKLDVIVESIVIVKVYTSLVNKLRVCVRVKLCAIRIRSQVIVAWVVMTQKNIVVGESSDESVAVDHAVSMAENRGKVKRRWTVVGLDKLALAECVGACPLHPYMMTQVEAKVK